MKKEGGGLCPLDPRVTPSVHSHVTPSVHSHVTPSVHSHVTRSVHSHDGDKSPNPITLLGE